MRSKTLLLYLIFSGIAVSGYCQEGRTIYKDTAFINAILQRHNIYRTALSLPPLQWSPALAADALVWARHLAETGKWQHDTEVTGKEGENLFAGAANGYSYDQMVDAWGAEKKFFREGVFPDCSTNRTAVVGHYTQLVWRNTTSVGCALVSNGHNDYLVCRYS